jgi:glycosyltransferase involved in cell wall biosynthesis
MGDILVSPRTEGTSVPLKIYSYLLAGKPIVATNLLAHTLVLHEDIALLVEPTTAAFADGLVTLIRDQDLRQRLGRQAQRYAQEKYDAASYLTRLDSIYRILEAPEHPRGHQAVS